MWVKPTMTADEIAAQLEISARTVFEYVKRESADKAGT